MKKILLLLLMIFILTSCTKKNDSFIIINDNEFLSYEKMTVFENNTYFLDLYLDDETHSLNVVGKLIYLVEEDLNIINIRVYPNELSIMNLDLQYLKINDLEITTMFHNQNRSLLTVELDETILKGETISLDFAYTFDYRKSEGRMSYYNDYYITMFFYPFVQINNEEPLSDYNYSFIGESYFNTIGDYFVTLNTPIDFITSSSGSIVTEHSTKTRKITNYSLENGRDFSFSTSPNYHLYQRELNGINFSIYSMRDLGYAEIENSFSILSNSFEIYQDYFGKYPYDYFTLEYGNIYGMESTGIIYCSQDLSIYTVIHEIIHQWLYFIIHNDQAREPFLDEALTTFLTALYFYETDNQVQGDGYLDYRSSLKEGFEEYFTLYKGSSLLEEVHQYQTGYAYIIYYHGPTLYRYYFEEMMEGDFELLKTFLQTYYNTYAFKEVTTLQALELLETTTGITGTKEWFLEEIMDLDIPQPLNEIQ